uniref:ScaE cell-surface anchored scaffoldin protein n=1 Tax=Ruminococcus flavefaciens TaxID=1265 RepID=UPI00018A86C7
MTHHHHHHAMGPAAGQAYDAGNLDVASSPVKPTLSITKKTLTAAEAPNAKVTMELSVEGAADKYAATGLHIQFDPKLKLIPDEDGALATAGRAARLLELKKAEADTDNSFFTATGSSTNNGKDGVLWSFVLQVPADAQPGDKYDVQVAYQSRTTNEDLFTNVKKDEEGLLMQAWTFTQGIEQGYIQVESTTSLE